MYILTYYFIILFISKYIKYIYCVQTYFIKIYNIFIYAYDTTLPIHVIIDSFMHVYLGVTEGGM